MRILQDEMASIVMAEKIITAGSLNTTLEEAYAILRKKGKLLPVNDDSHSIEWLVNKTKRVALLAGGVPAEWRPGFFTALSSLWAEDYKHKMLDRPGPLPYGTAPTTPEKVMRIASYIMAGTPMLHGQPTEMLLGYEEDIKGVTYEVITKYPILHEIYADCLADETLLTVKELLD